MRDEHKSECNCQSCHGDHIFRGSVPENSQLLDYQCCIDEFDQMVLEGTACRDHPESYVDGFYCEECGDIKNKKTTK